MSNVLAWFRPWLAAGILISAGAVQAAAGVTLREAPGRFLCENGGVTLVVDRQPWSLRVRDARGTVRFGEAVPTAFKIGDSWVNLSEARTARQENADSIRLDVGLANGGKAEATVSAYGASGFRIVIHALQATVAGVRGTAVLEPVEEIYGFGEMWNGHVAQRGQAFDLWDKSGTPDECSYMPYYVSTRHYALFLNYGGSVHFDVGQRRSDRLTYEAPAAELDLAIVCGDSIPSTVKNFLTVAGMPQRPPRWAFRPWFWLMSDPKQPGAKITTLKGEHFIEMVDRLKALDIPIGTTWFEPPWQDARTSFTPDPKFSADLPALIAQLRAKGVRTLAWTVPYTSDKARNWGEAVRHDYLTPKVGSTTADGAIMITVTGELQANKYYNSIDFFNPEAVKWWQAQIDRSLALGLQGYKLDAGQDLPEDAQLFGGRLGRDVHNSYAREYNRTYFEVLKKHFGDDFLMVPRAAWVGSGAYTNFKWPGDLSGSFANNGLPSAVHSALSLAFCGLPFLATDIGGFDDQPSPEAPWLRWAQFGAMMPGMETLHMPWWYSKESLAHFRYLTWLHTDLTPLWMSLAHEAAATGAPLVRPLVWSFEGDVGSWRVDDEFTVGTSLLVAPMLNTNPDRQVYLPAGLWYDFWDESETHRGPATVTWFKGWTAKDKFPLYVREGAIIPMEIENNVTGFGSAESAGYVTLAIWPKAGGTSEFTLHDTEGPVRITADQSAADLVKIGWDATRRNHLLRVHLADRVPVAVQSLPTFASLAAFRAGGEGWFYDAASHNLWVRKDNAGQPGGVEIQLAAKKS